MVNVGCSLNFSEGHLRNFTRIDTDFTVDVIVFPIEMRTEINRKLTRSLCRPVIR